MKVIDCHSHLSVGYDSNNAYLGDYIKLMKKYSIIHAFLMPQPILNKDIEVSDSLFDYINKSCFDIISKYKAKRKISFVPMISPVYTTVKKLEEYKQIYRPVAYKIHCKSDNSYPEMINEDFIDKIKSQDIPLIVHTDYSEDKASSKGILKNLNSALKWLEFFENNGIRGYLTHGARLNKEVLKRINSCNNVVIGLGPDALLNSNVDLLEQQGDYLKILHDNVSVDKLIFDVDFRWNVVDEILDLKALKRLKRLWNKRDLNKITKENAIRFFDLK